MPIPLGRRKIDRKVVLRQQFDLPRAVAAHHTVGRIPVATHALEDAVRPRLQGRMEMRGEALRCFDEEARDRVVDLRGLYRGKPEADGGDGPDEGFDELTQ